MFDKNLGVGCSHPRGSGSSRGSSREAEAAGAAAAASGGSGSLLQAAAAHKESNASWELVVDEVRA